jgi:xylan 1,4-beta-xylosidase
LNLKASRRSPASGSLASAGIDLPVLNVFRMLGKMSGRRVAVAKAARGWTRKRSCNPACAAGPTSPRWRAWRGAKLAVLVWHYHDDDLPGPDAEVALAAGPPAALPAATCQRDAVWH